MRNRIKLENKKVAQPIDLLMSLSTCPFSSLSAFHIITPPNRLADRETYSSLFQSINYHFFLWQKGGPEPTPPPHSTTTVSVTTNKRRILAPQNGRIIEQEGTKRLLGFVVFYVSSILFMTSYLISIYPSTSALCNVCTVCLQFSPLIPASLYRSSFRSSHLYWLFSLLSLRNFLPPSEKFIQKEESKPQKAKTKTNKKVRVVEGL